MYWNRFTATAILTCLCWLTAATPARSAVVIHTAADATSTPITLSLGVLATIDLFVSSDAMDSNDLSGVVLRLEMQTNSGALASAGSDPIIGDVDLDGVGLLFEGGNQGPDAGNAVQRSVDVDFGSNESIASTNDGISAVKFASVQIDTTNVTTPGTYVLLYQTTVGGTTAQTQFTRQSPSQTFAPPINSGITIHVVPEPSQFLVLSVIGSVLFLGRRRFASSGPSRDG